MIPFLLNNKIRLLKPYTTKTEKDFLIMQSFGITDPRDYLRVLSADSSDLSDSQAKILLWKYRELSLGSEVQVKYTCTCNQVVENTILASDFLIPGVRNDPDIKKLEMDVTFDNLSAFTEFTQEEIDDMPIDQYEELLQRVKDNQEAYDFVRTVKCFSCGTQREFNMQYTKYLIDSLSDENLASMYKVYSHLVFFGRYSREDIDGMYPFERTIFTGLLQSTLKEE